MNTLFATLVSSVVMASPADMTEAAVPTSVAEMSPAKIIRIAKPVYPDFAHLYGLAAEVVVEVQVGEDGKAKHVHLVKGDHPVFNNAVITAVANAEYAPATQQDNAVKSWVKIPFKFKNPR
jgi:TonB family protein